MTKLTIKTLFLSYLLFHSAVLLAQQYSYRTLGESRFVKSNFEFGVKGYAFQTTSGFFNSQKRNANSSSQITDYENNRQGKGVGIHAMWTIYGQSYRYMQIGIDAARLLVNEESMIQKVGSDPETLTTVKTYIMPILFKLKIRAAVGYIDLGIGGSLLSSDISNWISTETRNPSYSGARFTASAEIGKRLGTNYGLDFGVRYYFIEGANDFDKFQLVSAFAGIFIKV